MAIRSSKDNEIGAFVAVDDKYPANPNEPAPCNPAVASDADTNHPAGSATADRHTFARNTVGPDPDTCNRSRT